jgi:hypothetical protein
MNGSLFILYIDGGQVYVSKSHNISFSSDLLDASVKSKDGESEFYIWETTDFNWELADFNWDYVITDNTGGFSEYIPGIRSSSFSADGLVDFDGDLPKIWNLTNDQWELADFTWESGTVLNVQFNTIYKYVEYRLPADFELIYDNGYSFTGQCYLKSISQVADNQGTVSYSVDFTVDSIVN